jgi:biotin operon repressor
VRTASAPGAALETDAWIHLSQRRLSAAGLAQELGVSTATVGRILARLRQSGIPLVSVREDGRWHYEVRHASDLQQDPLVTFVIPARRCHPWRGKEEDRSTYA